MVALGKAALISSIADGRGLWPVCGPVDHWGVSIRDGGRDLDGYPSRRLKNSSSWFTAVLYSGGSGHVRVSKGAIHHDTGQPGRDRGIAVNARAATAPSPYQPSVPHVPHASFIH